MSFRRDGEENRKERTETVFENVVQGVYAHLGDVEERSDRCESFRRRNLSDQVEDASDRMQWRTKFCEEGGGQQRNGRKREKERLTMRDLADELELCAVGGEDLVLLKRSECNGAGASDETLVRLFEHPEGLVGSENEEEGGLSFVIKNGRHYRGPRSSRKKRRNRNRLLVEARKGRSLILCG